MCLCLCSVVDELFLTYLLKGPPRPMVSSDDLISMKCKIRPIWWRPSFVPVIDPDAGAVHRFLDWLHKQGYSRLILMGDSVTSNTAAHLMCDLARAGYRLNSCPRKYNSRNGADGTVGTGNSCDVVYSRDGSFQITIIAYRLFLPCTERTCHNHVNNSMMSYYSETLHTVKMGLQQTHNSSSSSSSHGDKALAVYNDGLHLMGSDQRLIQTNIAIGVLSLALSLKALNTTLVFRETSAQHFIYSPDGRYWGLKSQHNASLENKYCCSFPEHPRRMDERDETLLRDLRDLDALWFQRVGWAKFYEPTLALFADHVEATSWNSIDCTHFAYRPGGTGLQLLQAIMSAVDNWGIDPTPVELK